MEYVSILILLEVILEDFYSIEDRRAIECFNPYFTGSNSGSYQLINSNLHECLFQSLFYWK